MNRSAREALARDTVAVVERGWYDSPAGGRVELAPLVAACVAGTVHYPPGGLSRARRDALAAEPFPQPAVDVRSESTLAGAARLLAGGCARVAALNFASAKNPGGGFLTGAQAQEESLARSSALYASLLTAPEFYQAHRRHPSNLYTDALIVSPDCPVFRDDVAGLLPVPYPVTFVTSAAPNAGAVAKSSPGEWDRIPDVPRRRAEAVLAAAHAHRCDGLVLGAWGCGVFRNDPAAVAGAFAGHLTGLWAGRFRRVAFSVLDPAGETLAAFRRALGP